MKTVLKTSLCLFVVVMNSLPSTGQVVRLTMQEQEWLNRVSELVPDLKLQEGFTAAYQRNYFEAINRAAIISAKTGDVDPALKLFNNGQLNQIKTLPYGTKRRDVEKAIVAQLASRRTNDQVREFISRTRDRDYPAYWQIAATVVIKNGNQERADQLLEEMKKRPLPSGKTEAGRNKVIDILKLETAKYVLSPGRQVDDSAKRSAVKSLEELATADPVVSEVAAWGSPATFANDSKRASLEFMIRNGMGERAIQIIRIQIRDSDEANASIKPLRFAEVFAEQGLPDFARELADFMKDPHQKAFAYCNIAMINAQSQQFMEARQDLEKGLEILKSTQTKVAVNLKNLIAITLWLLGDKKEASARWDQAMEEAFKKNLSSAVEVVFRSQIKSGRVPAWERLFNDQGISWNLGVLRDICEWLQEHGDHETASKIAKRVAEVATGYSSGSGIGSDGMRAMRSDIWAMVMAARIASAADEMELCLKLLKETDEHHCCEGMRLVAKSRADHSDMEIEEWLARIDRTELKVYALIGLLEQRIKSRQNAP